MKQTIQKQLTIILSVCALSFASVTAVYAGQDSGIQSVWVGSLKRMANQMTATMIHQAERIGSLIDAGQQLETQRLFQELKAQAHKDYQPGTSMCVVGTNVRSLAASDYKAQANARILNEILQSREFLTAHKPGGETYGQDISQRMAQFKGIYCDPAEDNGQVDLLCNGGTVYQGETARPSRDIDFLGLVGSQRSLNVDFTDTTATDDEKDVIALGKYLFSNKVYDRVSPDVMDEWGIETAIKKQRSVHAMRSVARHSFSEIVAMKSAGSGETAPYISQILETLGVSANERSAFLGQNPSYFAQMEVLTKTLYERPEFYINLYDKPANVKRMSTSLQAIDLMQDRDRYESALRREMLVSLLLEARLREYHEAVSARLRTVVSEN